MKTLLCVALAPGVLMGCLHFDKNYKYRIQEGTKSAFLFHDGTQAHLVVRTDVKVPSGQLPGVLAWVMPLPGLPTRYEEMDNDLFDELGKITHPKKDVWGARGGHSGVDKAAPGKIKVHALKVVGRYNIQPIEILDPSGGNDFNHWLKKNRFNAMPQDLQQPYLKKGTVFLAIQVKLNGKAAVLKPLHVIYPSDELSFPLKFTHDTRTFDMDLFVFTPRTLAEGTKLSGLNFESHGNYVPAVVANEFPLLYSLLGERDGFISLFNGKKLNGPGNKLRALASDPTLSAK